MDFTAFPKKRPELPEKYKEIYADHYKKNREGDTSATSVSKKLEAWMHKKVAGDVKNDITKYTLEIGAGTLNQLEYEKSQCYDIVEPFAKLFKDSEHLHEIQNIYKDIDEIEVSPVYDRITSIATFEHIENLPHVVAKSALLLKNNGCLRFAIPNEGTFLWKLGYTLTTGVEFRILYGLNYEVLMRHEHINTASEIDEIVRHFFGNIRREVLGIHKNIGFYRFYECSSPNIERANNYLQNEHK